MLPEEPADVGPAEVVLERRGLEAGECVGPEEQLVVEQAPRSRHLGGEERPHVVLSQVHVPVPGGLVRADVVPRDGSAEESPSEDLPMGVSRSGRMYLLQYVLIVARMP